jgi:prepilin signal peptidase PulO-like enzyme (type II secretory pathway)
MISWLIFVTLLGACVGSFLNVVVYRVPLGKSIVSPPSACPKCNHQLAWYDNVPVLGWVWLRGKCRYCANPISPQYPLIEAATALLFAGAFWVCYVSGLRPDFKGPPPEATAAIFVVTLALIGSLIAATLIDARLFIIPLSIPWFVTGVAVVVIPASVWFFPAAVQHVKLPPANAALVEGDALRALMPPYGRSGAVESAVMELKREPVIVSAAPWAGDRMTGAAIGAAVMLVIANVLLRRGVLPLSFPPLPGEVDEELKESPHGIGQVALLLVPLISAGLAAWDLDAEWRRGWVRLQPLAVTGACMAATYIVAVFVMLAASTMMRRGASTAATAVDDHAQHFGDYPYSVRHEMLKELLFVGLPVVGAVIGAILVGGSGPSGQPLFGDAMHVLGGVLLGYLASAGLVWAVRIGGSLGFGKEAMGLGDVHLMGAVGAVAGWQVGVLAFFVAPFIGLAHTAIVHGFGKLLRFENRQIPYGPHLAVATVIVMILKEPLTAYFGVLFG